MKLPKNKSLIKVFIVLAVIILVMPFAGYILFAISFSGGIDSIISNLKPAPNPKSSSISIKRDAAKNDIGSAFDNLEQSMGLGAQATATYDHCYKGQNNWKREDGYAHRCGYRVIKYYGFNGDFRQKMLGLEQELFRQQWQASNGNTNQLSYYIENYYGVSFGDGEVRSASSMPALVGGYSKNGMTMDMGYAEKDGESRLWLESIQRGVGGGSPTYQQKDFVDMKSVFAEITKDNAYLLTIALEKNYFEN